MRVLPESTERVLRSIDALPAAGRLVLAGGTALALRIGHRSSADLDFVFASARLPRRRLKNLMSALGRTHRVEVIPNLAAEHDFIDSGLDLADYQQDHGIDDVKVTFFVPDPPKLGQALEAERGVATLKNIRVLQLDSLFLAKAVTLNTRITTRDLFDLYTLVERHGYAVADVFKAAGRFDYSADVLKTRLLHASRRRDDPGIETPTGTAPSFEQLQGYFAAAIDRTERVEAETAFSRKARKPRRP